MELYIINAGANILTISAGANSIWVAGTTSSTIALASGAVTILQWVASLWIQIK